MEGVHNGWWLLLDEVNLATAETLQCLSSLLENQHGFFLLPEQGYIICACACVCVCTCVCVRVCVHVCVCMCV